MQESPRREEGIEDCCGLPGAVVFVLRYFVNAIAVGRSGLELLIEVRKRYLVLEASEFRRIRREAE